MPKTVTLRLSEDIYQLFHRRAEADHRPLSNLIVTAARRQLEGAPDMELTPALERGEPPVLTARRLLSSGLVGIWKTRKVSGGPAALARRLRAHAQKRG